MVILIYGDDLGRGMLSCYGQQHFETPNIDRLSSEGVQFRQAYGCAFCAPSRASMMTGLHDCRHGTWTYTQGSVYKRLSTGEMTLSQITELIHTTGLQAAPDEIFLAQIAQEAGYVTGEIGKLEWGFDTTSDRIRRHGWDYHYGWYDHARCHGFYPPFPSLRTVNYPTFVETREPIVVYIWTGSHQRTRRFAQIRGERRCILKIFSTKKFSPSCANTRTNLSFCTIHHSCRTVPSLSRTFIQL